MCFTLSYLGGYIQYSTLSGLAYSPPNESPDFIGGYSLFNPFRVDIYEHFQSYKISTFFSTQGLAGTQTAKNNHAG
jgi:hypothetical protein